LIITDTTRLGSITPKGFGRGLDLPEHPDYSGVAEPFPDSLLIPRSEWQARIEEREERKATLQTYLDAYGVQVKDQGRTNYCWINAPTYCVEVMRARQGLVHVPLSPASAGAQIKGFRNVGGWGKEGLEFLAANGAVPSQYWPDNAIDRKYATPENKERARWYRPDEWWVLANRDIDQLVSCLLRGIPVAVGYNWWGHEVTAIDPVWLDGEAAIRIANSWGKGWGENGYGILQGRRMLPDDAVAPRTALAS
jgi:hypothetical protein